MCHKIPKKFLTEEAFHGLQVNTAGYLYNAIVEMRRAEFDDQEGHSAEYQHILCQIERLLLDVRHENDIQYQDVIACANAQVIDRFDELVGGPARRTDEHLIESFYAARRRAYSNGRGASESGDDNAASASNIAS